MGEIIIEFEVSGTKIGQDMTRKL